LKKSLIATIAFVALVGIVYAGDVIEFAAPEMGNVTFQHKKHQGLLQNCKICHVNTKGEIEGGFSKDWAHKTCRGCHVDNKKGPTRCTDCHKMK